ncbi:MAG TPA: hypothetical protein VGV35_07850 [Bryobacteraceae bacterium]|nr:hypothetical protein [Bryobacteraceae bacterium]
MAILERYVEDLPAPEQQAKWHGLKQTVAKMKTRANLDNQANRRRQGRVAHHFK